MANIAVQRIKRELKEVLNSDEVNARLEIKIGLNKLIRKIFNFLTIQL